MKKPGTPTPIAKLVCTPYHITLLYLETLTPHCGRIHLHRFHFIFCRSQSVCAYQQNFFSLSLSMSKPDPVVTVGRLGHLPFVIFSEASKHPGVGV